MDTHQIAPAPFAAAADILYSDGSHGAQYQYSALFVGHVTQFLKG
jgi:hypothetical protein